MTGDKKTPVEAKDFCVASAKEFGIECIYQTPEDQIEWLKTYPELGEEIPWNSIQRRNLAILLAYEKGCEVIITIDDDNYFVEGQDFVGEHSAPILKGVHEHSAIKSNTNWLNVCEFLEDKRKVEFYPRGFPMNQRWTDPKPIFRSEKQKRKIIVNAGLWLDDPDVDAITRLTNDISALRYTKDESFSMQKGTWCPFNSQNTAMAREMIPAYCLSPNIGRYDDIWAGSLSLSLFLSCDSVCVCVSVACVCMCVRACVRVCVYVYICMYIYMYICIYRLCPQPYPPTHQLTSIYTCSNTQTSSHTYSQTTTLPNTRFWR